MALGNMRELGWLGEAAMTGQLEDTIKLLILLSHRAPAMDDSALHRKVDALVDSYLVGFGTETVSKRWELAKAFHEKAAVTPASERIRYRIERNDA
jgi:hypothetical protein